MRTLLCLCIFTLLFLGIETTNSNAQAILVDAKRIVNTEKAEITVKLVDEHLTSIRVTNVLVPQDSYKPIDILNEQVLVFFAVKLKVGKNVFYVDAFSKDDRVDGAKLQIDRVDAPSAVVAETPASQAGTTDPLQTTKPASSPAPKLGLQSAPEISNQTTAKIQIDRSQLPSEFGAYVAEVKNSDRTDRKEFPMETEKGVIKPSQTINVPLREGDNAVTIFPRVGGKDNKDAGKDIKIKCNDCFDSPQSASTRAIVGYEQIGASSSTSKQNPFLDFYFDTPFAIPFSKKQICVPLSAPGKKLEAADLRQNEFLKTCIEGQKPVYQEKKFDFSIWGNVRLSSIPVQTLVSFSNLNTFQSFIEKDGQKSNDLTQSFDFMVGLETKVPFLKGIFGQGFLPGRASVHLIAAVGAINPIAPSQTAQIFKIPKIGTAPNENVDPRFLELFPEAKGNDNIAFVSPLRDHFFRQYFAGIRLKTNFFERDGVRRRDIFPAMVDVTIGQNEAITGSLHGLVSRIDGSTPFPIKGLDFLYFFGSAQLRLGKKVNSSLPTFFLEPSGSTINLSSPKTVIVPVDRYPQTISNRDVFRMGIGVDFFRLFKSQDKKE